MLKDSFWGIRIMFSLLWRAASCRLIWHSRGASCALPTFVLNPSEDQHINRKHHFLRSSPCGKQSSLFVPAWPPRCPRQVFQEVRNPQQYKWKFIKMISLWALKTSKYSKSAQDYKQNEITQNRSTWPVAAHSQMTIYDRFKFWFKSPAGITVHTL